MVAVRLLFRSSFGGIAIAIGYLFGLFLELYSHAGVPLLAWFLQLVFNLWWLPHLVLVLFEVRWFPVPYAATVSRLEDPGLSLASFR